MRYFSTKIQWNMMAWTEIINLSRRVRFNGTRAELSGIDKKNGNARLGHLSSGAEYNEEPLLVGQIVLSGMTTITWMCPN